MKQLLAPLWQHPVARVVLVLSLFGVAMVYSAGLLQQPSPVVSGIWIRQAIFLAAAVLGFLFVCRVPTRWIEWSSAPIYILGVALLAVTLVVGTGAGTAKGVSSFLAVGGFRFQPAEAAKVATALGLAALLVRRSEPPKHLRELLAPAVVAGVPSALVLLQPDLGTALAFVGIFFAALVGAGTPWPLILLAASPGVAFILAFSARAWALYSVLLAIGVYLCRYRLYLVESVAVILANVVAGGAARALWRSLSDYQRNRLLVYLDPGMDPQNAGWQLIQSKVAVGSGGFFGQGFTMGTQKRLAFLPEQHTDFIFSVVGEEFGFLGTSSVLLLFGYLFYKLIGVAEDSRSDFAGLFAFGVLGMWMTHVFVNVGMTVGVVPITGIPLPFISYGGSFLLMSWMAAAVVVALSTDST